MINTAATVDATAIPATRLLSMPCELLLLLQLEWLFCVLVDGELVGVRDGSTESRVIECIEQPWHLGTVVLVLLMVKLPLVAPVVVVPFGKTRSIWKWPLVKGER